ncbi:MAG TPA: hypothetical protein P5313_06660, partial [Spirochaetia bacterium]|nr:hypothetical protein [Spirochaetia bacterium]
KRSIETLFDIIPVGLVALSPENEVVRSNPAFRVLMERWSTRLVMSNHRKGSRTVVTILSASYGVSVPEKLFNPTQFYK